MTVGTYEAKTKFAALLKRAARGEQIVITKHDRPLARLVGASTPAPPSVRDTAAAIRAFRRGRSLRDVSIKKLVDEGRM